MEIKVWNEFVLGHYRKSSDAKPVKAFFEEQIMNALNNMKKIGLILIAALLMCVGVFVCISVFIWHNTFTSVLLAAGILIWLWILEAEQNN